MRCGLILKKLGMTRFFQEDGLSLPVTILKLENTQVVNIIKSEKNGYNAIQIGTGTVKTKNIKKSIRGHYAKSKVEPKRFLKEFRVSPEMFVDVGKTFSIKHFMIGQKIDVTGISIGKGFSGGMKRHNFSGLEATHGVSISHRSHGSTGNSQDPGRVWKGKKMAGQYGNVKKTVQNLEVIQVDEDNEIIYVKGSVPGSKNSYIVVKDALKKPLHKDTLIPAGLKENNVSEVKKPDLENSKQEIKSVSPNDKIIQGSEDDQIPLTKDVDSHQNTTNETKE